MTRTILVTGAAGFAGGHLLELLEQDGDHLAGWYRPGHPAPPRGGVSWTAVDLLDREAVAREIAALRPAVVYHCAGAAHVGRAWQQTDSTFATNVRGTHYLVDALERAGVDARVVVPSSALVYRPSEVALTEDSPVAPTSPYGLSKLAQELMALDGQSERLRIVIARAFNHTGPRQDAAFAASAFAKQVARIEAGLQAPEIVVGNLEARRDLTDVRDTVRGYWLLAQRGRSGRTYNVCAGRALVIGELLEELVRRATVAIRIRVDPALFRPNDVPVLLGDPSRMDVEIGWTPSIPFARTLDDLLQYWRTAIRA